MVERGGLRLAAACSKINKKYHSEMGHGKCWEGI